MCGNSDWRAKVSQQVFKLMKNNIQQLRKAMQLSQEDLAAKAGVSRQTINSIETGKFDPSLPLVFKLLKTLDVSLEELFIFEEWNYF